MCDKEKINIIRQEKLKNRASLSSDEVKNLSEKICKNLLNEPIIQNAKTVLTYLPYGKEVSLMQLNEYFWNKNVKLLVPVCRKSEPGIMDAVVLSKTDMLNLKKTKLGVMEPENGIIESPENIDLVLVPGVVFDKKGNRMGHGMGYYDRYLTKLKHQAITIGIGYELQTVDDIPSQPWDFPLDYLCTEQVIYKF